MARRILVTHGYVHVLDAGTRLCHAYAAHLRGCGRTRVNACTAHAHFQNCTRFTHALSGRHLLLPIHPLQRRRFCVPQYSAVLPRACQALIRSIEGRRAVFCQHISLDKRSDASYFALLLFAPSYTHWALTARFSAALTAPSYTTVPPLALYQTFVINHHHISADRSVLVDVDRYRCRHRKHDPTIWQSVYPRVSIDISPHRGVSLTASYRYQLFVAT